MRVSRRCGQAAGAAIATALLASTASAQPDRPIRLEYEAPETCPSRDEFLDGLRARTDHVALAPAGTEATLYRITLSPGDPATGRVESRAPDGTILARDLPGATCAEVADALALVVALAIDAAPTPALTPTPAPPLRERPPLPPGPAPSRWALSATAGASVSGIFVGPEAFLEAGLLPARRRGFSFVLDARAGASRAWSTSGPAAGGGARFMRTDALLDLCPLRLASGRLAASACVRGEAGTIEASASAPATRPWFAGGALALARWTLADPVFVLVEGGAVVPLVRDRYFVDEPQSLVYSVPPVDARASAGVGARFW